MDTRQEVIAFLKSLRDQIIKEFEAFEPHHRFKRTNWEHNTGGGGEMSVVRGDVFEKAAVNWSGVTGPHFPMQDSSGPFFATGISVITHMHNPYAPTVHMNIRFIETQEKSWFGGGFDLTPMGPAIEEDTAHFHHIAKTALDPFGKDIYPTFSAQAREYFFIPHRKKERGVGGIFFDHYNTGDFSKDKDLWMRVGSAFLEAIIPIYRKRIDTPFHDSDKIVQLQKRAHYAEFNLVYDRGTKFGFSSGGNPDAILCSMPPSAAW